LRPLFCLAMVACYSPSVPAGSPCTSDTDCPSSQVCEQSTKTCQPPCVDCADATADQGSSNDCWGEWLAGTVTLTPPVRVEELAIGGSFDPSISFDGLVMYFSRSGSTTSNDILRATRPTRSAPFGAPSVIAALQTPQQETRFSTNADDTLGIFASDRIGTVGAVDLWQATRASGAAEYGNVTAAPFAAINNTNSQFDPELTPDGLDLYYAPSDPANKQTIQHASRGAIDEPFSAPALVAIPGAFSALADPAISPDQRVLVFAGNINGGSDDLYFTTRSTLQAPFSTAVMVPGVNQPGSDSDVDTTADGCTLYFVSDRNGQHAIYTADVIR
jgi:hypothetical protein